MKALGKWIWRRVFCLWMRGIWTVSRGVFMWAEDRRPAGGFRPENLWW